MTSQLLEAAPHITCGILPRLPVEILVHIFNASNSFLDRLCLALTCKKLLQASSLVRIRVPSVAKHRFLPPSTCDDIFLLLRRLAPRDGRGWRPHQKVGLCCDCLRYRTRRRGFWSSHRPKYLKMGVTADMWKSVVKSWYVAFIFQCPDCWCDERYGGQALQG
ncbi:hypothetical protein HRG_014811 [Hirsutella rhossiliensis]